MVSPGAPLIGVLALQGDVSEHEAALQAAGARTRRVRRVDDLEGLDGLVIPGGESTTIGALARERGLDTAVRSLLVDGLPVWGTCAGMILLAADASADQPLIGGMDVDVDRNAFGRQVDSFEAEVPGPDGAPFRAVFIRAPAVTRAGRDVEVLARLDDGAIVAVREGQLLATAFHPELGGDLRWHEAFIAMARERLEAREAAGDPPA